jgi:hypothetical protein
MILRTSLLITFLLVSASIIAQPKNYLCMQPIEEMLIDGKLDEWSKVSWTDDFIDITGQDSLKPFLNTRTAMMWDSNYLYVAAVMEEPHLWATITERDAVIYMDNDFEIFIDPDGDTHNYAEIEVNAYGTVWDLFLTRPYRDGTVPLTSYNIEGLKCAVDLKGTINDPSDTDSGWVLEMAIPWKSLSELTYVKRKPYPGEYWRINFSRVHWDLKVKHGKYVKAERPEYNWVWSPQGRVDMHMPEKWGYVFFHDKPVGVEHKIPRVPYEESIKEFLRELYETQKAFKREYGQYTASVENLDTAKKVLLHFGGHLSVSAAGDQYLITYTGFMNSSWFIDQTGKVWKEKKVKAWVWMHGNDTLSDSAWVRRFRELSEYGIDGILIGGSNELLERIIPLASEYEIEVQAWRWMLNCNDPEVIEEHPEWYSVSREGYSCLEKQPYVGYYKWLCPSREGVREYVSTRIRETLAIEGLAGFHMDYIRHPDVILPRALWEKYGLYQDHEMPEYDYCYCDVCRSDFKQKHGYDPLELEHPDKDGKWRQFRYDIVSDIVNSLEDEIGGSGKKLSAAVFPSPEIARTLVRQDWDKWHSLQEVFPMIYHSFYNEDIPWIGETTWAGVYAIDDHMPLYSGLYIPSLTPYELNKAILYAIDAGASGVALFEYGAMSEEHWKVFQKRIKRFK